MAYSRKRTTGQLDRLGKATDEEAANYYDSLGTALVELTHTSLFR